MDVKKEDRDALSDFMNEQEWGEEDVIAVLAAQLRELAAERRHSPDKAVIDGRIVDDPHDLQAADDWDKMAAKLEEALAICNLEVE